MFLNHFGICLFILAWLPACQSRNFYSPLNDKTTTATLEVRYPVNSGPGFVLVTEEEDALLKSIKETSNIFGNPVFWDFMDKNPDVASSRLREWYRSMERTLPENQLAEYRDKLGKHFPLLLDPGILFHIQSFQKFYSSADFSSQSSAQVRKSFWNSLAAESRETYRGMLLEEDAVEMIKKKGLVARVFISDEKTQNQKLISMVLGKQTYQSVASSTASDDMLSRLGGREGSHSVYSSFTDYIPVTHAGCWVNQYGKIRRAAAKGRFYLLRVKVNPLDLIRPEGHFSNMVQNLEKPYRTYVWENGEKKEWVKPFQDVGFENFVHYVSPQDIQFVPYNDDPPHWWM